MALPINLLNFGLMVLIALTIVASLKTVGVVMVLALLITPGATAYLLVPSLPSGNVLSCCIRYDRQREWWLCQLFREYSFWSGDRAVCFRYVHSGAFVQSQPGHLDQS
jgi:hypothetical protein